MTDYPNLALAGEHLEQVAEVGRTLRAADVSAIRYLLRLAADYLEPPQGKHFRKA